MASIAGLVALGLATAGAVDMFIGRPFGHDFAAYLIAAHRLARGRSPYPEDAVLGPFGQFLYSPPAAIAFVPFTWLPLELAFVIWTVLVASTAVVLGTALVRRFASRWRLWAAAVVIFFVPLLWDLTLGNVNIIVTALAVLGWHIRARPVAAGATLAAALLLKPLALGPVLFLLAVIPRIGLWVIFWSIAAVFVTVPWIETWREYVGLMLALWRTQPGIGSNIIPTALGDGPFRVLLPALSALAIIAAAVAARRDTTVSGHGYHLALAASPLLFSTLWYPYLVLALPLLLHPPSWSGPTWGSRRAVASVAAIWTLMQIQLAPEPGRSFTVPLVALVALIAIGTLRLRT